MIRRCLVASFALAACTTPPEPPPPAAEPSLPEASRLFVAKLSPTRELLLGATGSDVWAASLAGPRPEVAWRVPAPGILQRVAAGNTGEGLRVYLAFGRGRGKMDAPLTVLSVHPRTGDSRQVTQWQSGRAEFTHLSVVDSELVYAAYDSKYQVREWRGGVAGQRERMATSRGFADLDGDGRTDRVVGRIYGDEVKAPGDLRVELATGTTVSVPVNGGVRSLAIADTRVDDVPTLYFADGWSASYAREGRALLKRAIYRNGAFEVEPVVESHDEYTFNRVQPVGLPGEEDLLLYGSSRVSWLFRDPSGAVGLREMRGRRVQGFGELVQHDGRVFMAAAGSPTIIEEAPTLR